MNADTLYKNMCRHVSPERLKRIEEIAPFRTRYITLILENIHYTQNLSAIVRSCDCFGIQDIHLAGKQKPERLNRHVSLGAANWVDVYRHEGEGEVEIANSLKQDGYRIIAALPSAEAVSISDIDLSKGKTAVILGNEMEGISDKCSSLIDEAVTIPMHGFSESFNISVSAAVILYQLTTRLRSDPHIQWQLSEQEILELKYRWIRKSARRGKIIESEYEKRLSHPNDQK